MDNTKMLGTMEAAWVAFRTSSAPSILFTILGMSITFMVYFCTPDWRMRKLPSPPANFLLGHLPLMAKYGPNMIAILAKEYGPIFKIRMGRQPLVILADPELCREVMIKKFKIFRNRSLPLSFTTCSFLQKSLIASIDDRWTAMRNTVVSIYQPSVLASFIPSMQSYIESAVDNISQKKEDEDIDFADLNLKMSTDVLGMTAFGVEFGLLKEEEETNKDDDVSSFLKAHDRSTYAYKMHLTSAFSMLLGLLFPILETPAREILKRLPWTLDHKIYQANQTVAKRVDAIVAKKEKELDYNSSSSKDFISAILRERQSDGPKRELFTSDYISSLAYEHILGGSSSTAFTISSILYLVSKHPEVEKKLQQEIDAFGPHDVVPNAEDLHNKFPYIDWVILEAQRHFSPSPMTARKASQAVEIGGYVFPEGTWIWLALDFLAKDPKSFPEPEVFRPERFDPNCEEQKKRHQYAFIPFGIGPRQCIGKKFALQEIKLAMVHMYRNFSFTHSPNMESPIEFEYGGVLVNFKHGVKLRAKRRSTI